MTTEQLVFIGATFIIAALLYIINRSNLKLAELITFPLVQEIIKSAVSTALDLAEARAKTTETLVDDEFVQMIRDEVAKQFNEVIEAAKRQSIG
jgi:hypothetical protein